MPLRAIGVSRVATEHHRAPRRSWSTTTRLLIASDSICLRIHLQASFFPPLMENIFENIVVFHSLLEAKVNIYRVAFMIQAGNPSWDIEAFLYAAFTAVLQLTMIVRRPCPQIYNTHRLPIETLYLVDAPVHCPWSIPHLLPLWLPLSWPL